MTYISAETRRIVAKRAHYCCEYCRLHEDDHYIGHEVDHIIATKHRGQTVESNLCYSCIDCNRYKGSDVGSFDIDTSEYVGLFNPRTMLWSDHFTLIAASILPVTAEGRVTEFLLRLNSDERLTRRRGLILTERYPCPN
jgi:hypothetical protein